MINAGFTDAWQSKRAPDPGFTACQAENLLNPASLLDRRIDLVLFRGGFGVADISLIGNQQADRTGFGPVAIRPCRCCSDASIALPASGNR